MSIAPQEMQEAIGADDTGKLLKWLRGHPEPSYEELQECLTKAMLSGSLRVIETLLDHGATLSDSSNNALFARAEPAAFQQLIDHGWDINSTEFESPAIQQVSGSFQQAFDLRNDNRALHNESLLRWLLGNGADPNVKSVRRRSCLQLRTALAQTARLEDPTALQILLSHGAEMDPLALFDAIKVRGNTNGTNTMTVLIDHRADVNYMAQNWATPLVHAAHYGSKEKVSKITPAESARTRSDQELYEILKAAEAEHTQ